MSANVRKPFWIAKKLPDDCSWEDVMYQIYVRQKIQAGLDDAENDRVVSDEEVFAEFGQ